MGLVLGGMRVLEFSDGWTAGAWVGRLLAELGADVIKVEPPGGDTLRHPPGAERFGTVHAGKRFRVIDPAIPEPDWFRAALAAADIVVDGLPARADPPWRPAVEAAATRRPDLILVQVSVFGRTGPLARAPGSELTSQAWTGVMETTGYPDSPPARAGVPVGEHAAALYAVTGILAALIERESSGLGQTIDVATHDCLISYLGTFLPAYFHSGTRTSRIGNRHTSLAPWNVYPASDGWLTVCSGTDNQWRQIAALIGRPDLGEDEALIGNPGRVAHADVVDEAIAAWSRERTAAEVSDAFDAIGIPVGPILTVGHLLADDHVRARDLVRGADSGTPVAGRLFKLSEGTAESLPLANRFDPPEEHLDWTPKPRATSPTPATRHPTPASAPLAGLRIIELASYTAGPYCGRILASLGAEVLKVEPPAGDGVRRFAFPVAGGDSYLFQVNNADTESVTIDTRSEEGRRTLRGLVRRSDAFFENFAAGTLIKQGLGPDELLAENPSLVYASVNGFGLTGPRRDRRAYDTVIQGLAGIMHLTGLTDRPPVKVGISIADVIGATGAAAAILAALFHRRRTGLGQLVDVSMHDLAGWLTSEYWTLAASPGGSAYRPGNGHPYQAPHGVFATADGRIAIAVGNAAEWAALRSVVPGLPGDSALADAVERIRRQGEIEAILTTWAADRSTGPAVEACLTAGVPAAPVLDPAEAAEQPQTRARGGIVDAAHPIAGSLRQINLPIHFSRSSAGTRRGGPILGAANARILGELIAGSIESDDLIPLRGVRS